MTSTHREEAKKIAGIDADTDDDKSHERKEKEDADKKKSLAKKKHLEEEVKKANDDEDFDDKAPTTIPKEDPIADDMKDETDDAKEAEVSKNIEKLMSDADNAVTSASQIRSAVSHVHKKSTSVDEDLDAAKSIVSSLTAGLEMKSEKVATKPAHVQTEHGKHSLVTSSSASKGDREGQKAELTAKLAKLEQRQQELLSKLSHIH